ncbi:hypothetical protein FNV43_RR10641 [Rhamnella rubrinervis]|uniref:Uncharacterized protein n=1 Tax=Rhamnella rubrinervis TaxID=2594499 RepID=A0A8K0H4B7_9ROSA|nr:hypothetical protein FNV43_RR10641 [Rhamnella rubrinervis]
MEELRSAMEDHMNQMEDLVQKFSDEVRSGLRPAYDNFIGFFYAIDWKVRLCFFLSSLFGFLERTLVNWPYGVLCSVAAYHYNFEEEYQLPNVSVLSGLYDKIELGDNTLVSLFESLLVSPKGSGYGGNGFWILKITFGMA